MNYYSLKIDNDNVFFSFISLSISFSIFNFFYEIFSALSMINKTSYDVFVV